MRILVLGSGVIGVTTAYYLAHAGHEVVVVERHSAPASGTSFANAGQISTGYAAPWAAPGMFFKALSWLTKKHAPLHIAPDGSLFQLRWLYQMLRNCTASRYAINKSRMVKLAQYSRACLSALRTDTNIQYEGRQRGTLQVFRTQRDLDNVAKDIEVLKKFGIPYELLSSPASLLNIEPRLSLNSSHCIGGLHLPEDETGDCLLFTRELAAMAEALGVRFIYDMPIDRLIVNDNKISGIVCGNEILQADNYVVALGTDSTLLLRDIVSLPVYPVKGYSITIPIIDEAQAPQSTVLDETYKVAITRFASRIRVGGIAEMIGYDNTLYSKRCDTLTMIITQLFPGAGDTTRVQESFWTGLRAMTPDGTPIVGATTFPNLFINTGHGTLGWTMACGSAKLLADLISQKPTDIEGKDYSILRYR